MKTTLRLIGIVGTAAMLGGCQSFPLTSWMFKGDAPAAAEGEALAAANPVGTLEEGRASLRDGNVSAAVASFRIALLDRSTRAEASNGLGVAYARLGRDDLAERYFQAAISAEPDNQKFVANLFRLQQVTLARRAARGAMELAAQSAPVPAAVPRMASTAPQAAAPAQSALAGPVARVSRSEVRVVTRPELGNAPAMAVSSRQAPAEAADQAAEAKKDDKVAVADTARQYPVRIVFGE